MDHTKNEPDSSGILGNESREVNRAPDPQNSESGSGLNEIQERVPAQCQVLENEDLLDIIFTSVFNPRKRNEIIGGSNDTSMKNLLWISLTCKQFFDPAINILWRSMNSWAPLLRLIPSVVERDGKFTIRGAVLAEHLKRFMFYAKRISEFDLTSEGELKKLPQVAPYLYAVLEQHRQLNNISFPILQTLAVDLTLMSLDNIHILFLLPTLPLAELRLKWQSEPDGHVVSESFLHTISLRSPTLVSLSLEGRLTDGILDIKNRHNFCELRDIALDFRSSLGEWFNMLDIRYLSQLTTLENLITLSMIFTDCQTVSAVGMSSTGPWTFASLKTLNIYGTRATVRVVLTHIHARHLIKLNVTLKESVFTLEEQTMLSHTNYVVSMVKISGFLKTLNIESYDSLKHLLPSSLFPTLLEHSPLRRLTVSIDLNIHELIKSLRGATLGGWSALEILGFYPSATGGHPQSPMLLSSIEAVVSFFPNLKSLSAPVSFEMTANTIEFMKARVVNPHTCLNRPLQDLHFTPVSLPIMAGPMSMPISEHSGKDMLHYMAQGAQTLPNCC